MCQVDQQVRHRWLGWAGGGCLQPPRLQPGEKDVDVSSNSCLNNLLERMGVETSKRKGLGLKCTPILFIYLFNFKVFFKRFYSVICQRERENINRDSGRQRGEAGSLLSKEPYTGLDPRTLGS